MKEDKQGKPVYESPKVLKLDETESAYGECNPGSTPGDSCGPGNVATGCAIPGGTATSACANAGSTASLECAADGASPNIG